MRLDLLLLLMVFIWGANFSVVKQALREFPELTFNALRLVVASLLFAALIWRKRTARRAAGTASSLTFTPPEWRRLFLLGVVGHFLYQLCFLAGVARTSVANSSLIFGCTPVSVALMAWAAGQERLTATQWAGVALSFAGLYALVGQGATWSGTSVRGDVLVFLGMLCWSGYSVLSASLLQRHSPVVITGVSMMVGTFMYTLVSLPVLFATEWATVSLFSWALMVWSAGFALAVAYVIWYVGIKRLGSSRTAIYSNLTPPVAIAIAAAWLGEPVARGQLLGAAAILGGVLVTRLSPRVEPQDASV